MESTASMEWFVMDYCLSVEEVEAAMQNFNMHLGKKMVADYYVHLPVVGKMKLIHMGRSACYMIVQKEVDATSVHRQIISIKERHLIPGNEIFVTHQDGIMPHYLHYRDGVFQCLEESAVTAAYFSALDSGDLSESSKIRT